MTENLWRRTATTMRERYRRSALAQYGAGLHVECEDCRTGPEDVSVPVPRQGDARTRRAVSPDQAAHVS